MDTVTEQVAGPLTPETFALLCELDAAMLRGANARPSSTQVTEPDEPPVE
ncbi:MAG TPA: hypothetical protein PLA44_14065 [Propionibacteriaceae bacterium]|nr:hypothetical protein [Propionibacteriaceae bacterium]